MTVVRLKVITCGWDAIWHDEEPQLIGLLYHSNFSIDIPKSHWFEYRIPTEKRMTSL